MKCYVCDDKEVRRMTNGMYLCDWCKRRYAPGAHVAKEPRAHAENDAFEIEIPDAIGFQGAPGNVWPWP